MILCGVPKGDKARYRCPYCGFQSDDIEDFAVSMCWSCAFEPGDELSPAQREQVDRVADQMGAEAPGE